MDTTGAGSGATRTPTTLGGVTTGSVRLRCCAAHTSPSTCSNTTPVKVSALASAFEWLGEDRVFITLVAVLLLADM